MTEQEKKEIILKASLQRISTKTKDYFDLESGVYAVIDNEYHKIPEKLFGDFLYDDDISTFNIKKSTKIKNGIFLTHNDLSGGFYIKDDEGNKKELVSYDNQTGEVQYLFGNKSWYGIEELDNCEDKILEAFPKLADDKTKNYERKDRFGNPLVADWMFMYLVNAGREELERSKIRNKDIVNISEELLARDLYSAVQEASDSDELNKYINKDIFIEDYNEIVGFILDANIDFTNALLEKKFAGIIKTVNSEVILSHGYKGYVPDELLVADFKSDIKSEYNEYKQTITKNFTKEGIFDRAFEISFFSEMNDYLQSLDKKDVDDVKEYKKNDFTLAYLYDRYIHNEYASIANGEEIKDFLTNEISKSQSRYQENEIER